MAPHPEAIKHFPKSLQTLVKKLYNRIFKQNKNALCVMVGQTGSGKSYDSLAIISCFLLYRDGVLPQDQEIIDHVMFKALEFMRRVNNDDVKIRGEPFIWDEAGIDAGNQDYGTVKNKVISWYAQTCRNQHQLIIFTLPTLQMLTTQVRKLLHYYFEAVFIDASKKLGVIKPLEMQYNTRMDKIYYHRLSERDAEGYDNVVELCGCPLMHESLIKLYEKKKTMFTDDLNDEIQEILEQIDLKKQKDRVSAREGSMIALKNRIIKAYDLGYKDLKSIALFLGTTASALSKRGGTDILVDIRIERGEIPRIDSLNGVKESK